jgi:coenzyme F420-reducing hydrogenase delta subunit
MSNLKSLLNESVVNKDSMSVVKITYSEIVQKFRKYHKEFHRTIDINLFLA